MNAFLRKITAVLLTLTVVLSCMTVSFTALASDDEVLTACGGDCPYAPSIVIPGVFQSQNRLYDDDGNLMLQENGKPMDDLFTYDDFSTYLKMYKWVVVPLLLSVIFSADIGLSKAAGRIAKEIFSGNAKNNDGEHIHRVEVLRYPDSVARCTQEGKDFIYSCIPLEDYSRIAGEDHLYMFTYDSFGSISQLADELYEFIQKVKRETGHDKINLVPISQGGTIANELMERYRDELTHDLDRLVLIVPALDGSAILGKIFSTGFIKDDRMLYHDLIPSLMDDDEKANGYLINLAIRLFSKNTILHTLDSIVDALTETILVNSTCMWALTPQSEYDTLYQRYLADGTREKVRQEVEYYHKAQVHSRSNLLYLQSHGVEVFDLVDYDHPLYPLFDGWDKVNGDGVIQLDSTSAGATSCPISETLPDTYVQKNTFCTCGGNHISPDRKVDASTGVLCETTFYFDEGDHEETGGNDVIISLAVELLTNKDFKDVHSYPDRYPQFNTARESDDMRDDIRDAENVDLTTLDPADAKELQDAVAEAKAVLLNTVVDLDSFRHADSRLRNILIKLGLRKDESLSEKEQRTSNFLSRVNDWAYRLIGPRGFGDVLHLRHITW